MNFGYKCKRAKQTTPNLPIIFTVVAGVTTLVSYVFMMRKKG